MQEEEEAKERTRNQPLITAEPSYEDLEKEKESEVEEAKALIAQRADNPREFFKQKEKAVATGLDISPVSSHRTGKTRKREEMEGGREGQREEEGEGGFGSPDHLLSCHSPPHRPQSLFTTSPSLPPSLPSSPPGEPKQQPGPVQDSTPTKPIQSVAPQTRTDSKAPPLPALTAEDPLVDLWDSSPATGIAPSQAPHPGGQPQPLLSFDEMGDVPFCPGGPDGVEEEPSSLVDVAGTHDMTLSYQQALQHASDDTQLMTNGETLLKEGTQVRRGAVVITLHAWSCLYTYAIKLTFCQYFGNQHVISDLERMAVCSVFLIWNKDVQHIHR
uniref:Drebrin 1 n=1 Tax=Hucho hucho TaxID=62062 RepID=A0A4W5NI38_9TELE